MPISLGETNIGTVVRPARGAYMSSNALVMEGSRKYEVTGKQGVGEPSFFRGSRQTNKGGVYTWLTEVGKDQGYELGGDFKPSDRRNLGTYQCRDEEIFLTLDDAPVALAPVAAPPPAGTMAIGAKKSKGRGDRYAFAWGDDEISLQDMPRQAQLVAQILFETGKSEFEISEIESILAPRADEISKKQPPIKIFEFYRSKYMERGLMTRS